MATYQVSGSGGHDVLSEGFFEEYSKSTTGRLVQAISHCVGTIKLPGFAVLGTQSSGKSTLLQTLSSE